MARGKGSFQPTPALQVLDEQQVDFRLCPYPYEDRGGTAAAAEALSVDEHTVVKTLVMETDTGEPFLVLMHGDRRVSTKAVARSLGVKKVRPCAPGNAHRHTGYRVGGISPFGTRKDLPVCVEETLLNLEEIYINAGRRGLLAALSPRDVVGILRPRRVRVAE